MDNNRTVGIPYYTDTFQQISDLLNLPLSEIENKYTMNRLFRQTDYSEKEFSENLIEIRFEKQEMTIICAFNFEEKCNSIYLFPDRMDAIESMMHFFKESFDYDYIKNRWAASGYFIEIKKVCKSPDDLCFVMY